MTGFALQLRAAVVGDLDKEIAEGLARYQQATQAALWLAAEKLQGQWRQDVASSGLAKAAAMSKTIRTRKYPNKGLDPAALVYSTFPLLQRAFEAAKTITARGGKYLLIPNPDVWPGGRIRRARGQGTAGGASIQTARARFGELRFIPPRNGRAGLIVAEVGHSAKTGKFRAIKSPNSRSARTTIIVFYVVRKARQERRLRGDVIRARAERSFAADMQRDFDRLLLEAERGPLRLTARGSFD